MSYREGNFTKGVVKISREVVPAFVRSHLFFFFFGETRRILNDAFRGVFTQESTSPFAHAYLCQLISICAPVSVHLKSRTNCTFTFDSWEARNVFSADNPCAHEVLSYDEAR